MTGMLRDARLIFMAYCCSEKAGERILDRFGTSLLNIIQVLDGSDGSLTGDAKQAADLLRELDPGLHTCLDHAEKQHGHECEGKRDQPTFPEEITKVQIIKKLPTASPNSLPPKAARCSSGRGLRRKRAAEAFS